jgi:quinol-cytochrome oxidoreductase complex cytochrome b subunit
MKRLEVFFERWLDRMLQGNLDSRIARVSVITLLFLAACIALAIWAANLEISTSDGLVEVWRLLLDR